MFDDRSWFIDTRASQVEDGIGTEAANLGPVRARNFKECEGEGHFLGLENS
jgi:hypothetical protein